MLEVETGRVAMGGMALRTLLTLLRTAVQGGRRREVQEGRVTSLPPVGLEEPGPYGLTLHPKYSFTQVLEAVGVVGRTRAAVVETSEVEEVGE